ncbi:uncharacterized protein LOC141855200 isoform X5 [Brevipalpus obovatus]|uniref:uncharacterized protein LOC141855200 isoform X5 n=1 Tax=Brevipalpus obovatus TaxID=246614 RepID=UPI003D9EB148
MAHIPNGNCKSSSQYRQKALQEIRMSLIPFMNNERPTSSASSTASGSSSSPGQFAFGPCGLTSSSTGSQSTPSTNGSSSEASTAFTDSGDTVSQYLLNLGFAKKFLSNLSLAQQQQLAQQLHALSLNNPSHSAIHVSLQQHPSYPHSPASLSSLYSSVSTPPYAASSSSGRLSPTPTISSSSEYSSIPPPAQLQKLMSSASSTCSSQTSSCLRGPSTTAVVSSVIKTSQLQAWSARQAKSQSPVIMQSVKSTQVQKPVLQTAIAPTAPPVNASPLTFITPNSGNLQNAPSSNNLNNHCNSSNSVNGNSNSNPNGGVSLPLKMTSKASSTSSASPAPSVAASGGNLGVLSTNQQQNQSSPMSLSVGNSHNNNNNNNSTNSCNNSHFATNTYTGYLMTTCNSVPTGMDSSSSSSSTKLSLTSSSNNLVHLQQSQPPPPLPPPNNSSMPPPPPPPYLSSSDAPNTLQANNSSGMPVISANCSGVPPPPYISAVQQSSSKTSINASLMNVSYMKETEYNGDRVSYRHEEAPPPPPPPPYPASFPAAVSKESSAISANPSSLDLPDYPPRLNGNGHPVNVPTTDPPSYASSVAALAVQRVVSSVPVSTVVSAECNNNLTTAKSIKHVAANCNGVVGGHTLASTGTTLNSGMMSNMPNISQLPARPPPPLPPNSDLVNTVESICASQVGAIHCSSTGPPLPPKPGTMMQFNDAASVTESECSSTSTSTCNGQSVHLNGPLSYNNSSTSHLHHVTIPQTAVSIALPPRGVPVRQPPSHPPPPPPPPLPSSSLPKPPTSSPPPPPPPIHSDSSSPPSPHSIHSDKISKWAGNGKETSSHADSNHRNGSPPKEISQSPIPQRRPLSKEKEQERRETKVKNYSPAAFKFFMEQHVENVIKSQQQRERRRLQLETEMQKVGLSESAQRQMRKMLHQKESNYIRLKRAKMKKSMFTKLETIGVGAFGEVALVRKKDSNQLYAMKTLRKTDVLKRNQVAHVKAERDILAEADNEWVVKLYYSFQDSNNLYFVMDYIPGGDLMSLLIKLGVFEESLARFYIAELILAVESVHKMGFIHRDIKPDNILIDRDGHIKLTDFGLCTGFRWTHNSKYYQRNNGVDHSRADSMDIVDQSWSNQCHCGISTSNIIKPLERRRRREHQRCQAHSLVGTPNYIAPEVLMRTGYSQTCDWWSVGVILFEMLVGHPPFLANTPEETQAKVINWKNTLRIPVDADVSREASDLMLKLCCGPEERLGRNGADEIKKHPFFHMIDFDGSLRRQKAPYIPKIRCATDTSNFDPIDQDKLHQSSDTNGVRDLNDDYLNDDGLLSNGKHPEHAFFEFTFRRFFDDGGHAYPMRISLLGADISSENGTSSSDNGQGVYV